MGTKEIKRIAMITNPAAGKGSAMRIAQDAHDRFSHHGIDDVSLQGATAERSLELAEAALEESRLDALVVCGGDGLINLALQSLEHYPGLVGHADRFQHLTQRRSGGVEALEFFLVQA